MKKLLIGLDFGSDSVRALLVSEEGEQLAVNVQPYRRWNEGQFCSPSDNQYRQHPLDYLEGMETAIRTFLKPEWAPLVTGIGLDTTGSTPCAVDREGTPLALLPEFSSNPNAMFILWKDHTALEEAARINDCAAAADADYRCFEGGSYSSEWFWSKILHVLKVDARVREAAFSWVEHCDWMGGELCGDGDVAPPDTKPCGTKAGVDCRRNSSSAKSIRCWPDCDNVCIRIPGPRNGQWENFRKNGRQNWACPGTLLSAAAVLIAILARSEPRFNRMIW